MSAVIDASAMQARGRTRRGTCARDCAFEHNRLFGHVSRARCSRCEASQFSGSFRVEDGAEQPDSAPLCIGDRVFPWPPGRGPRRAEQRSLSPAAPRATAADAEGPGAPGRLALETGCPSGQPPIGPTRGRTDTRRDPSRRLPREGPALDHVGGATPQAGVPHAWPLSQAVHQDRLPIDSQTNGYDTTTEPPSGWEAPPSTS
jgi:hypothetical protein